MSLNEQQRSDLIRLYLTKSENTWDEFLIAINAKRWNMAANRLYYSLFNIVTALLVKDEHPVGTHRGTKAALGQHYVLTNKITPEAGRLYSQLSTLRERADYDVVFEATEEDIMKYKSQAEDFIKQIKTLLL